MSRAGLLALLLAGALGAGCGVETDDPGRSDPPSPAVTPAGATATTTTAAPPSGITLPSRPSGLVVMAGPQTATLTPDAVRRFHARSPTRVELRSAGEDAGFRDFCAGRVDIVESARLITRDELAACRRNGLTVVKELQVASDAVVVATKNQYDVGGDCLSVGDVRAIYQRGSTIDSWSDLGFDAIELDTTGPDEDSTLFTFFGQRVLGLPQARVEDLRSGYEAERFDRQVRLNVTGEQAIDRARRAAMERLERRLAREARELRAAEQAAERRAEAPILRAIERENRARAGEVVDADAIARRNLRRVQAAKRRARRAVRERFERRAAGRVDRRYLRAREEALAPGTVGLFRFSYYEQFEEQLRPMEIDAGARPAAAPAGGTATSTTPAPPAGPQCVFPSRETISSGVYPLARPVLLYTTRRGLERSEVRQFLVSYLRNAEALANANRLVPIDPTSTNDQIEAVLGRELRRQRGTAVPGRTTAPGGTSTSPDGADGGAIPGVSTRASGG